MRVRGRATSQYSAGPRRGDPQRQGRRHGEGGRRPALGRASTRRARRAERLGRRSAPPAGRPEEPRGPAFGHTSAVTVEVPGRPVDGAGRGRVLPRLDRPPGRRHPSGATASPPGAGPTSRGRLRRRGRSTRGWVARSDGGGVAGPGGPSPGLRPHSPAGEGRGEDQRHLSHEPSSSASLRSIDVDELVRVEQGQAVATRASAHRPARNSRARRRSSASGGRPRTRR